MSDSEIAQILEEKKLKDEMSAYINDALRFYQNNAQELAEIKQTLIQVRDMISNGVTVAQNQTDSTMGKQTDNELINPVLMNSLDVFEFE